MQWNASFFLNSEVSETKYRKLGAELTKKEAKGINSFYRQIKQMNCKVLRDKAK